MLKLTKIFFAVYFPNMRTFLFALLVLFIPTSAAENFAFKSYMLICDSNYPARHVISHKDRETGEISTIKVDEIARAWRHIKNLFNIFLPPTVELECRGLVKMVNAPWDFIGLQRIRDCGRVTSIVAFLLGTLK